MAKLLDPHVDILLVGDSLGMVLYGMSTTREVSLAMMIAHAKAVVNHSSHALVAVDMPFGTYETSPEQAYANAASLMTETGCQAVKLEGGTEMAATVRYLTERNIPVVAHVGLLPQSVTSPDGFKTQGKSDADAAQIIAGAKELEKAGAFSMVIEGVTEPLARAITESLRIPTIGIGASPACDGQVMVTDDMLGITGGYIPKFVKSYAALASDIENAVKQYADEVKTRTFPSAEFCYPYKKD
jgi:3-methyl-2-oxobutanoate hydroxymethyltransferase